MGTRIGRAIGGNLFLELYSSFYRRPKWCTLTACRDPDTDHPTGASKFKAAKAGECRPESGR